MIRRPSKIVQCPHCLRSIKAESWRLARNKSGAYCSRACFRAEFPKLVSKQPVYKLCIVCGRSFAPKPFQLKRGIGKTCSRSCASKLVKNRFGGKWHDSTTHGRSSTNDYRREKKHIRRARIKATGGAFNQSDIDQIYKRQHGHCVYCKAPLRKSFHVDHVVPIAKGGSNWPKNLQLLCRRCNCSKRDLLPEKFARKFGLLI